MPRPLRRAVTFLLAVAIQSRMGRGPWDPATGSRHRFWLDAALSRVGEAVRRSGGSLAPALPALAAPFLLSRLAGRAGGRLGPLGLVIEAGLLASTFDLWGPARAAVSSECALKRGDQDAAREALGLVGGLDGGMASQEGDAQLATLMVVALADAPADSFLASWLSFAIFGTPAAVAYRAAQSLEDSPYPGWLKLAGVCTARRGRLLRAEAGHLTAPLVGVAVAVARPGGADPQRVWGRLAASSGEAFARGGLLRGLRSLPGGRVAMSAALDRCLLSGEDDPAGFDSPQIEPPDIVRARSVYLATAATAAGLVVVGLVMTDLFRAWRD